MTDRQKPTRKTAPYDIDYALKRLESGIEWAEMFPADPAGWLDAKKWLEELKYAIQEAD